MKNLHTENGKILRKKIKQDVAKWKDILSHGLEVLILLKCSYYLKLYIYLFNAIPIKMSVTFFSMRKTNPKMQKTPDSQRNLKREQSGTHAPW